MVVLVALDELDEVKVVVVEEVVVDGKVLVVFGLFACDWIGKGVVGDGIIGVAAVELADILGRQVVVGVLAKDVASTEDVVAGALIGELVVKVI